MHQGEAEQLLRDLAAGAVRPSDVTGEQYQSLVFYQLSSVATSKPAIRGHFKTGQRAAPRT
jgi:hypothetical protein